MALCPRCNIPLVRRRGPHGMVYACPKCRGREAALAVLRRAGASPELLKRLWAAARAPGAPRMLRCPHCQGLTSRVALEDAGHRLHLDVCDRCLTVWFDGDEFDAAVAVRPAERPLSPEAREQLALLQIKVEGQLYALDKGLLAEEGPPEWWQWGPALAGMPVEEKPPERTCRPWLTWVMAATVAVVFVATAARLGEAVNGWGFVPALWFRHSLLTIGTSFFLHAGLLHVAANLYFLLLFADNVEDDLGWWRFVLLVAGAHVAGVLLHFAGAPHSDVPLVGASAGISGIVAYYAITFPGARVGVMWRWLWFLIKYIRMTALEFLGLFVLVQFIGAWREVPGFAGVAYLAHLGGLAVGIAAAVGARFWRKRAADLLDVLIRAAGGGGT